VNQEDKAHNPDPRDWVDRYGDYLYNYAIVRVMDAEVAADLVQETFLSALKSLDRFEGRSSERTWLTAILKRKIFDTYRKKYQSRDSSIGEGRMDFSDEEYYKGEDPFKGRWIQGKGPNSHSLLPEGELEQEELMEIIRRCISLLPENLATVFVMKMMDESESEEICKELGITASNLWVMLHRARLRMRDCLESKWLT
jgi:RNA polymerase sigma-70 factor (ECF subfamily)